MIPIYGVLKQLDLCEFLTERTIHSTLITSHLQIHHLQQNPLHLGQVFLCLSLISCAPPHTVSLCKHQVLISETTSLTLLWPCRGQAAPKPLGQEMGRMGMGRTHSQLPACGLSAQDVTKYN